MLDVVSVDILAKMQSSSFISLLIPSFSNRSYCGSEAYPRNTGCELRILPTFDASPVRSTMHTDTVTDSFTLRGNLNISNSPPVMFSEGSKSLIFDQIMPWQVECDCLSS